MQELLCLLQGGCHGRLCRLGQNSKARRGVFMELVSSTQGSRLVLRDAPWSATAQQPCSAQLRDLPEFTPIRQGLLAGVRLVRQEAERP